MIVCQPYFTDNSPTVPSSWPIYTTISSTEDVTEIHPHASTNDPIILYQRPADDYDHKLEAVIGSAKWLRKALRARVAEILAWTREGIKARDTMARQDGLLDAPLPKWPRLVEHKHRYVRRITKRRVCSGSSRYRVLAN